MDQHNLQNLVDLHAHLSTSTTAHLLWETAHHRGIKLKEKDYWKFLEIMRINHEDPYNSYHNYYDVAQTIQSSPEAIERSFYEAVSLSYRKANTDLLEIRFNPMRRNWEGLYDLDRVIYSAIIGVKKACMIYPVKAGIIIEMDRRFDLKKNSIIAEKAIGFRNEGVIGLDLSGPATPGFDINELVGTIDKAKSYGLGITVHSGEEGDISEMWDVVNKIQPDRIGHGILACHDPKLLQTLLDKKIHLEVCPTSNISLKLVKDWDEIKFILDTFKQYNISFNINSDAPVILSTNVKQEYERLLERQILSNEDVARCLENARKHSFVK